MGQESLGGQEQMGGGDDQRVIAASTTTVAAGATVSLGTFTRKPGEEVSWGGWPVDDAAGLALGNASGFLLWIERTAVAQQFTLRATNATGADRALEWWVRGVS